MKNAESINTETLIDLINELSEINKWLTIDQSARNRHHGKRRPTGEFFFDFDPSAAVSKEEYDSAYAECRDWPSLSREDSWTKRSSLPDYIRNY